MGIASSFCLNYVLLLGKMGHGSTGLPLPLEAGPIPDVPQGSQRPLRCFKDFRTRRNVLALVKASSSLQDEQAVENQTKLSAWFNCDV